MASPVSFLQRMPPELSRRLERAEALAREALLDTHAALATDLVRILAPRMPFDDAIERYLETMDLEGEEKEAIGTRAVALMGEGEVQEDLAREGTRGWGWDWRYATPLGVLRYISRVQKRSSEEELWLELAAARAEEKLVEAHVRYALEFVELMDEHQHADPTRAVAHYVERLDVPDLRARTVYQRVLARLAEDLLPRLPEEAQPS
jgi:nitrate reductase assembly molybdenum cofactor insertion protein NarJ